jgi:hypothetical protein
MSNFMLEKDLQWLEDFKQKYGRLPRILHIGNIANNAYLNAKILNRAGFKCDVICYDYYHVMGCPEWEDADIKGNIENAFSPDWNSVDLQGFSRPKWFIQGERELSINKLIAKFSTNQNKINFFGKNLSSLNKKSTQNREESANKKSNFNLKLEEVNLYVQKKIKVILDDPLILIKIDNFISVLLNNRNDYFGILIKLIISVPLTIIITLLKIGLLPYYLLVPILEWKQNQKKPDLFLKRINQLEQAYQYSFPERKDLLNDEDLLSYQGIINSWKSLFSHYDIIHGYATDGILPLLAEVPYVTYEHGTIRYLPFQATTQGRLCALTYKLANWVCITNCDNIIATQKLGLNNYSFVPHPINEDFLEFDEKAIKLREELRYELDSDFIIFHPSRQHWEAQRHPDWEKGNDIFIKGLAQFISEVNPKASAVFVEWGKFVDESKKLIEELGISHKIKWIPLQPNRQMIRYIQATDLLADQFFLGAFGTTMPRALACGKPAMLYLNEQIHQWCFEELPPVINTKTSEDVFQGLKKLYLDHDWAKNLANSGRLWYEKYHSNSLIVSKLNHIYRKIIMKK